jgi:hypothetical protein
VDIYYVYIYQILGWIRYRMSCGGHMLSGFTCGARRFDKYKFTTDKPSNQILHQENQKKLSDLLRLREEQDKGIFQPVSLSAAPLIAAPLIAAPLIAAPLITTPHTMPLFDDTSYAYYALSDAPYKCKKD